jgi:two-component system sensor histidine kinase YesM
MNELRTLHENEEYLDAVANNMELHNLVNSVRSYKSSIHSVFLFDSIGNTLSHHVAQGQLVSPYDPHGELWYSRSIYAGGGAVVSGIYTIQGILPGEPAQRSTLFATARAIIDIQNLEIIGTLAIFSHMEELRDLCSQLMTYPGERIFIADQSGTVIYSPEEDIIGKPLDDVLPDFQIPARPGDNDVRSYNELLLLNGNRYMWIDIPAAVPDWRLIRIIPEGAIDAGHREVRNGLLVITIILAFVCVLIAILMSRAITRPIRSLMKVMIAVENEDFSIRFNAKYKDEIGQLGRVFNSMLTKVEALIHDVYFADLRKKDAELTALQAQINPHFIYNTLESIRMTAKVTRNKEIADMVFALGDLLRYSINIKHRIATVREEVEHLQNYMKLQNHRFDNKFILDLDIPESFYDLRIIKLIFQPIVENCIYHALELVDGKGIVRISCGETDGGIFFCVEDNGAGMSQEELNALNSRMNDFSPGEEEAGGVGLRNVNEKIKLYYGDSYGINISSSLGAGTKVTLNLPGRENTLRFSE